MLLQTTPENSGKRPTSRGQKGLLEPVAGEHLFFRSSGASPGKEGPLKQPYRTKRRHFRKGT